MKLSQITICQISYPLLLAVASRMTLFPPIPLYLHFSSSLTIRPFLKRPIIKSFDKFHLSPGISPCCRRRQNGSDPRRNRLWLSLDWGSVLLMGLSSSRTGERSYNNHLSLLASLSRSSLRLWRLFVPLLTRYVHSPSSLPSLTYPYVLLVYQFSISFTPLVVSSLPHFCCSHHQVLRPASFHLSSTKAQGRRK